MNKNERGRRRTNLRRDAKSYRREHLQREFTCRSDEWLFVRIKIDGYRPISR